MGNRWNYEDVACTILPRLCERQWSGTSPKTVCRRQQRTCSQHQKPTDRQLYWCCMENRTAPRPLLSLSSQLNHKRHGL